ncbi:MAG TPA: transcription antitermination factor NusB [Urbifossiella sp.]|jgi:N utilization substance protein B
MLTRRSRAREVALQLLFQTDQNPTPVPRHAIEKFVRERLHDDAALAAYCLGLVDGVASHQAEIDPLIAATADNWRLARMTPVDRNVLRLGTYELLHGTEGTPLEVVLDECIGLAQRFGSKDSGAFVNGVLDKVARLKTPAAPAEK